jgi:hypothetical protein
MQIVELLAAATYLAGALEPWVVLIVFVTIGSSEWVALFLLTLADCRHAGSCHIPSWRARTLGCADCVSYHLLVEACDDPHRACPASGCAARRLSTC